ncbi:MAG: error-prone DNA polymerase [Myxococcota bacterium]
MTYAELAARSAYSFLQGASTPDAYVHAAHAHGLSHLAIVDRDGVYGLPEAYKAARECGLELICGASITIRDQPPVTLLAENHTGWSTLCRHLTRAHRDTPKGTAQLPLECLLAQPEGLTCLLPHGWEPSQARALADAFGEHLEVLLTRRGTSHDRARARQAYRLAEALNRPVVASSEPLFHQPERRRLADTLTAIRRGRRLDQLGRSLQPNASRVLRDPQQFAEWFSDCPAAVRRTLEVAERCRFRLDELRYVYPHEVVPRGETAMSWLRTLTAEGAAQRWPQGVPTSVEAQIDHELSVIELLDFPSYFLTVHDIVRFARSRGILCQGRGSAANSAVCYALGITAVDPSQYQLLFERFISPERGEPPDIDVDFEHQRREEVIQYIYERYGRHRAAMVNNVITYRSRSAIRDVGKAFGLSLDQVDHLARRASAWRHTSAAELREHLDETELSDKSHIVQQTLEIAQQLVGLPRHVGVHSGGFVISNGPLIDLVPVEPATMEGRTVVQWDKYAIEALSFIKIDVLALGMLTAIRRSFDLIREATGRVIELHTVPREDPEVYAMFTAADTMGVFQIESRAQQSMLPRLAPACFYDLVVEVAIVRPGPIQGGMVHPYLRRRQQQEEVSYAHPDLEPILSRTLGVPLFQEQVMAMAVAVGGFTPGEADALRRAMGAWRRRGGLNELAQKLVNGMLSRGISRDFADAILEQIRGFGEYGFPESHAASFALLVYVSGWIKRHHPAAFCAALINSQPMGFYPPRALIGDAQRHGVEVRPICVMSSAWDCTLEPQPQGPPALRLGLRLIRGLQESSGVALLHARDSAPFQHLADLARRASLPTSELQLLAESGALHQLCPNRRKAVWELQGLWTDLPLFAATTRHEPVFTPRHTTPSEALATDYERVGFSLSNHPAAMAREHLRHRGMSLPTLAEASALDTRTRIQLVGLVSSRQRPGTAKGVMFIALEDETGLANLVIWPKTFQQYRKVLTQTSILGIDGQLQRQDGAWSVLVERPWAPEVEAVNVPARDFR